MLPQHARGIAAAAAALLLLSAQGPPSPARFIDRFDVYVGNLHAHTTLSEGSGTPSEAYRHARDIGGLDFMAVTEHNHSRAEHPKETPAFGAGTASSPSLYRKPRQAAAATTRDDEIVTLFGREPSTISAGNHMGVLGASNPIAKTEVNDGDF